MSISTSPQVQRSYLINVRLTDDVGNNLPPSFLCLLPDLHTPEPIRPSVTLALIEHIHRVRGRGSPRWPRTGTCGGRAVKSVREVREIRSGPGTNQSRKCCYLMAGFIASVLGDCARKNKFMYLESRRRTSEEFRISYCDINDLRKMNQRVPSSGVKISLQPSRNTGIS